MKILIIDNTIDNDSWGSYELARFGKLAPGATVYVRRAPHDDLPRSATAFDRLIISGSRTSAMEDAPWIARLHDFVRKALNDSKPVLGVCYGHQTLARVLGGKEMVRRAAHPELGWTKIDILETSPLLSGLKDSFYSFSSHYDEVGTLPPGVRLQARSADCGIQSFQLIDRPVFGIQFHPEKDLPGARKTFAAKKKNGEGKILLHPERSEELYDPKVGETIFGNFFKL